MKRKAPSESKLEERLAELNRFVKNKRLGRDCKDEYDWACHRKLFQESLNFPTSEYLETKRKVAAWKTAEAKLSAKSVSEIAKVQKCFLAYSVWLNAILKELDRWFDDHPLDPPKHPKYIEEYKIKFLNWVCRGLSVPYSSAELKLPCIPLTERKKNTGPIRILFQWYVSLRKWSRQEEISDALAEWSATVRGAPSMDFFLLWSGNLYQQSWCRKKLKGILELLEIAQEYSRELLRQEKTQYSHPECRKVLRDFTEILQRTCK